MVAIFFNLQDKREYRTNDIQEICLLFHGGKNPFIFPDQSSPVTKAKQKGRGASVCQEIYSGRRIKNLFSHLLKTVVPSVGNRVYLGTVKCKLQGKWYKKPDLLRHGSTSMGLDYWLT